MSKFTEIEIAELMQMNHPEKFLAFFPGMNEQVAADIFGLTLSNFKDIKGNYMSNAKQAASEMLAEESIVHLVKKLPFKKGETIIGFGDSITDDYQSWFNILTEMLNSVYGEGYFKLINAGISGNSSYDLIKRSTEVLANKPDWIFCMIGTNDAARNRLVPNRTVISFDETKRNLEYLLELAKEMTTSKFIWLTPPRINEQKIDEYIYTKNTLNWESKDLHVIGEAMKDTGEQTIDLWNKFGNPVDDCLLLPDGLHPSVKGHKLILETVLGNLI